MRSIFFAAAACAACFSDTSVKRDIAKVARVVAGLSTVLFIIAEAIDLIG